VRPLGGGLALLLTAASLGGCGARTGLGGRDDASGAGGRDGAGGSDACTPSPGAFVLRGTLRDLHDTHPDVESHFVGDDHDIVEETLGDDDTPVYAGGPQGTTTTRGADAFHAWFHDVPGVNVAVPWERELHRVLDAVSFASDDFFPLDGQGFGNEGREHNFHFTLEAHATFEYRGGETFTFAGDDDLFAFIDRRLVVDLGGVHARQTASVELDDLDLEVGRTYPIDLFFAERHTSGSNIAVVLQRFALCE
jgi:fibro-slime domain-containing protein